MTEKTVSNYLSNLEKNFVTDNSVLQRAIKFFHEFDQIEFDLGLIEDDQTTAIYHSWLPIVSVMGGNATIKADFLNRYLGTQHFSAFHHKLTVFLYNQAGSSVLPATALDDDPRYPFYQISERVDARIKGESERLNNYLELKTLNSPKLQGKLLIDIPSPDATPNNIIGSLLTKHSFEQSDLVLVFTSLFNQPSGFLDDIVNFIKQHQDGNKFVYLIDDNMATQASISAWQQKLGRLGLETGQFLILDALQNPNSADFYELEQRFAMAEFQRNYRILHALEKNIRNLENVVMAEVLEAANLWKERSTFCSLIILGFIATLAVFAEIEIGLLELLLDPIIGSIIILSVVAIMLPSHLLISRLQAKMSIIQLNKRQKRLHLLENLANFFEANVTMKNIMMPIVRLEGWDKKTKARLNQLSGQIKQSVQILNDNAEHYRNSIVTPKLNTASISQPVQQSIVTQQVITPVVQETVIQTQTPQVLSEPEPISFIQQPIVISTEIQPEKPKMDQKSALMKKFMR